ncbi:ribosome biogenesis GTP-binding protein YihA/YsxC [Pendulispora rubella]|uniref:Probable GTP-binding protein EngB n=1 Tax=Pendulispora rubella TaxID=2741070 RepID=A0ABZ2LIH5_9BACT
MTEPRIVSAAFVAASNDPGKLPAPTLAEVAFAGRSNVGKSSLLNAMMQRKSLARTSRTPGCTRQVNMFEVAFTDGLHVHLVDLPGYGYAKRSRSEKASWGPLLEGYLSTRSVLRAVTILVDVRRGPEEDDLDLVEFLQALETPPRILLAATKIDKLSRAQQKPAIEKVKRQFKGPIIGFSSVTGDGRDALWQRLRHAIANERSDKPE